MQTVQQAPTPKQAQLIALLDQGVSNEQMAEQMGIALATVKSHLHVLYRRCGVKSRTQLLRLARERGWLAPDPDEAPSIKGQRDALLRTLRDCCALLAVYATEDHNVRAFLDRAIDVISASRRGNA
jgi:DNA-binding CsgD family transcriptional regulator